METKTLGPRKINDNESGRPQVFGFVNKTKLIYLTIKNRYSTSYTCRKTLERKGLTYAIG